MIVRRRYTRIAVDAERCLVYGPRLGRLYLLAKAQSFDASIVRALGLGGWESEDNLADPALHLVSQQSTLQNSARQSVGPGLRLAYRLLDASRHLIPLPLAASLVARLARRASHELRTTADIGRQLHAIETSLGAGDCYPRALLTCGLALTAGLPCELIVGSLAPTRMMHAWCSIDGALPYEASPEHHMYQPLVIMALTP